MPEKLKVGDIVELTGLPDHIVVNRLNRYAAEVLEPRRYPRQLRKVPAEKLPRLLEPLRQDGYLPAA